jgi:uncharacterized protein YndB with AHSA1/START domain
LLRACFVLIGAADSSDRAGDIAGAGYQGADVTLENQAAGDRIDRASRVILATPRTLLRAFLDLEQLVAWRAPEGMTARIERFDPRIGGGYRMVLTYGQATAGVSGKTSATEDVVEVRFVEIAPDDRVVEEVRFVTDDPAFAGLMTITTTFEPVRDGTKVSVAAADVPPGISAADHKTGMDSSLRKLARLTE